MSDNLVLADTTFTGAVRGEILMSSKDFEEYKQDNAKAKNARNTAVGLINSKEIVDDLKRLKVVVYTLFGCKSGQLELYTTLSVGVMSDWLKANFKYVVPSTICTLSEDTLLSNMQRIRDQWTEYPCDGLVLTSPFAEYDTHSKYISYIATAFKFKAETSVTKVVDVVWNLSKNRYLIPKLHVETIHISGTDVSYCTGYNAQYIKEMRIGPGALVEVEKRGEIIPNVNNVIQSGVCLMPTKCPECDSELVWDGVHLACHNDNCTNADRQDLLVWLETLAPIHGLGDAIKLKFLTLLFGENLSVDTVMNYKDNERFVSFGRSGHKKAIQDMFVKLYGLDNSKISLKLALQALNVPRLGDITANKLAEYPKLVKEIVELATNYESAYQSTKFNLLHRLALAIGNANSESIFQNLYKFKRLNYIYDRIEWAPPSSDANFKGKVAVTGKLSVKRSEFEKELSDAGYKVAEISKDTKFLITDDPDSTSSKNKKANMWNVPKISESDFRHNYL